MAIVDPFENQIVDPFETSEPEDNLPSLTQGEPMSTWEKVKSLFDDPDEESARAVQALVDSEALKISPSAAYRYRDAIDRGEKINPQAANLRSNLGQRVKQSWETGLKQRQIGLIGSDFVLTGDPAKMEEMQSITFPTAEEEFISEGRLESAVRSAAKMLPIMVETSKESIARGLEVGMGFGAITALVGQTPPLIAFPEEIGTVPAATALGFKVGASQGAFESALKMEAGLAVSELLKLEDAEGNTLDPNIARASAFGIGTINAAIEVSQLKTLLKTVPGFDKILSQGLAETVTSKAVKDQLFALARRYATTIASETSQEVAQESVNIVFEELSKSVSRLMEGTDIPAADAAEIVDRLKQTATESAQGFAVLAAPGTVAGVAGVRGQQAEAQQVETPPAEETPAEELSPEEVAQTLADAPEIDEADVDAILTASDEEIDSVIESILSRGESRFETFKAQVSQVVEPEQADAVSAIMEARANAVGMTPDEYIEFHNLEVRTAGEEATTGGNFADSLKQEDYRGLHKAPGPEEGVPGHDMTGDVYPDDIYGDKAAQYYGHGDARLDRKTVRIFQSIKGNPDADVTIYRAIPGDVKTPEINPGDWVTINKDYATMHGESTLQGDYRIIERTVKAKEIFTNGDSIHEWGYWPEGTTDAETVDPDGVQYNQEGRIVTETPEFKNWFGDSKVVDDSGAPLVVYHGTKDTFDAFDATKSKDFGIHFGTVEQANNAIAKTKFESSDGGRVLPVYLKIENPIELDFDPLVVETEDYYADGDYHNKLLKEILFASTGKSSAWYAGVSKEMEILLDDVFSSADVVDEFSSNLYEEGDMRDLFNSDEIKKFHSDLGKLIQGLGHDGVIYENELEGDGVSYAVFSPTQIKSVNNQGTFDPENPNILEQVGQRSGVITKASVVFDENKTIINAFERADISSLVHELGHVFRRDLGGEDLAIAAEWAGARDGVWDRPAEEKFARGFERYLADGKAPTEELQSVFEQLKDWLLEIYRRITGSDIDVEISPEIRGVFDRLLTEQEQAEPSSLSQTATLEQTGPKESAKTRIRRMTGQAKDNTKTVSEREALKAAMKKAAQAARAAEREGRTEGVAMERARLKALMAKATERRKTGESIRSLKAKIKKELRTTKVKRQSGKPVGKFTPEIQQTLDTLRTVSKLSPAEAEGRIADNLAKYENELPPPEVVIENHLLEMVARLDTMDDPEALKTLLEDIRALKTEGRELRAIKVLERARINREAVDSTVEELGGLPENLKAVGIREFTSKSRFESAKKYLHTIGKTIVGWDDILDILSFKTKTRPGESFISKNNNLLGVKNAEKRGTRVSMQEIHDIYREAYGIESNRQMLKRVHEDNTEDLLLRQLPFVDSEGRPSPQDLKFTRAELRKRAMELMDPSLWPTFEEMGYTEQVAAEIFERLSVQDEMFIQGQLDFYRQYYDGTNAVYKEMYGVNLPKNDLYSPIVREGISAPEDGGLGEFMREMSFRASAATAGALKSRVGSVKTLGKQSDLAALQRHIVEMEHFKAWGEKIRDLNAVWKHPDVRSAVQIHHGRDLLALVDNFISDFAHNGSTLGHKLAALDKFRVNFTKSALAVRPSILIKQLTSFVAYSDAMPVTSFAKYHAQFWLNPVKNSKEILDNSELMKERGGNIDRDLKAAMQSEEYSAFTKHQSFTNSLLLNIKIGDQGAILMGGWPYYKWLIDTKGYTKEQAIAAFEKFTEQTQQSGDITEQSYWQRGGTLAKLLTMFMSSPNQYLRKEIAAIRNLIAGRQGVKQTAKTLMIYHVVLPMFFQLASDRFTWDEDEQKRALIYGPLNGWFIMGDGIDYVLRKALGMQAFDMEMPVYSVFHDFIKATALVDLFDLTEEEFFRAIRGLAGFVGDVTGVPFKTTVDTSKAVTDILEGEYEKGLTELMGYSPYKAEQLAND